MTALIFLLSQILLIGGITLLERRRHPGPTDWARNLQVWALNIGAGFFFLRFFQDWKGGSFLDGHALPFLIAFPVFLLVRDFTEFLFHVAQHRVSFLWRMHSLHHSDPEMSALTTNRHFWGEQVFKALTIWPLTTMIISQSTPMIAGYSVISLYNYLIHANLRIDFGKWSWLLNAPAYHRRHHSKLEEHYNSNYAALFPIWDVIFGTYHRPDGWPPTGQATSPERFSDLVAWPVLPTESKDAVAATVAVTARPARSNWPERPGRPLIRQ